ncbi:MAG: alpha/beta fold hydrolase [Polyangiales bacterium]
MEPAKRRARRVLLGVTLVLLGALLTGVRRDIPVEELLPQYAPQPSRFVELEGMRVHYRDEGSGPPLLLIHGTSSSLHTWDGWVRTLASHRRVLRLDLPGFGLTGPAPDADYSAERYARTVTAFLDHCGVAQADVAGNSLGGRVAVQLTLAYPARVRRLVLVDATGLAGQQPPAILGLARTPVLRELLTVVSPRFVVRQATEDVYGHDERVTEALVDRYHALLLREGNRRALVDRMSGSHDPDLDDRLAEVRVPTLLLWGGRDRRNPPMFGERFARGIAGAELRVYDELGHVPMEEDPDTTARDADGFLSGE